MVNQPHILILGTGRVYICTTGKGLEGELSYSVPFTLLLRIEQMNLNLQSDHTANIEKIKLG